MKRVQLEPWSTWEKMCLVNAVQKTGDQNWTAVSRSVRNIYDDTCKWMSSDLRPPHWFSMKQCAAQYESLLNNFMGSRRKKRTDRTSDTLETPADIIYNVLRNDFLEENSKKLEEMKLEFKRSFKKPEDIMAGLYDDVLEEMLAEDAKEKERDIKLKLKFKLGEKNAGNTTPVKNYSMTGEMKTSTSSTSPLLTSLLQSPSQHSLPSAPTISLLLNSAPSTPSNESPTLTKLLESPSSKVPVGAVTLEASMRPIGRPHLPEPPPSPKLNLTTSNHPPSVEEIKEETIIKEEPMDEDIKPEVLHSDKQDPEAHVVESEIIIEDVQENEKIKEPKKIEEVVVEDEDEVVESDEKIEEILNNLKEAIMETMKKDGDILSIEFVNQDDMMDGSHSGQTPKENETKEKEKEPKSDTDNSVSDKDDCVQQENSPIEVDEPTGSDELSEPSKDLVDDDLKSNPDRVKETSDEQKNQVQIDLLDQKTVVIIMGSNSNSVINVDGPDSSSEDITQSSGLEENKESAVDTADEESKTDKDEAEEMKGDKSEDDMKEDEDEKIIKDEVDDDSILEMEQPKTSFKESPLKRINLSQMINKDNLPEVMVSLEPIEMPLLNVSKEEAKTPLLDKLKKSRKRSSTHFDSKPTSPASTSFNNDDEREYRAWKKSVLLVFSRIASHKYASVFSRPIFDAPGYQKLIRSPMDLSTIKRNIEIGVIRTTLEFQRDVLLMIQNAVMYNPSTSLVYKMALEMWNDVINEMNVMVQALGDGVPLGRPTGEGDGVSAPTRSGRQAKLSMDKKKQDSPANTSKRRRAT